MSREAEATREELLEKALEYTAGHRIFCEDLQKAEGGELFLDNFWGMVKLLCNVFQVDWYEAMKLIDDKEEELQEARKDELEAAAKEYEYWNGKPLNVEKGD